jgi:hypothetical protein
MAFFCPLSWSVVIVMSPASREGCNSSAYFQNCLQVLVLSFPKIIAKATGDALEFAVTP